MKNIYDFKLGFRYDGHEKKTFDLSTEGKTIGDIIKLPHSYFFFDGFKATLPNGTTLTVSYSDSNADILVVNMDSFISTYTKQLAYTAIKLNKSRVCNTNLSISCIFVGDTIDPNDFGQMLNPDSEVTHKKMNLSDRLTTPLVEADQIVTQSISGQFGVINSSDTLLESNRLLLDNTVSIEKDKIVTSNQTLYIGTNSIGISLDEASSTFTINTPDSISKVITFLEPENEANTIPIVSIENTEKLKTVPWLKVGEEFDIRVPKVVTNDILCQNIKIGKIELKYDTNFLYIGNSIKINVITEEVQIGNVAFDTNLLNTLSTLVIDIQELKKKL